MINALRPVASLDPVQNDPGVQAAVVPPAPAGHHGPPQATDQRQPEADTRLIIDVSASGGGYVYTLTDRETGRILVQLPRQEVAELGQKPDYRAGALIRTEA